MTAATIQPITVWGHWAGPNPWKVIIILKELDIPYTHRIVEIADVKKPPLTDINPNGRVPAIEDPNTGVTLWEVRCLTALIVSADPNRAAPSSTIWSQRTTRPSSCPMTTRSRSSSLTSGSSSKYQVRPGTHIATHLLNMSRSRTLLWPIQLVPPLQS